MQVPVFLLLRFLINYDLSARGGVRDVVLKSNISSIAFCSEIFVSGLAGRRRFSIVCACLKMRHHSFMGENWLTHIVPQWSGFSNCRILFLFRLSCICVGVPVDTPLVFACQRFNGTLGICYPENLLLFWILWTLVPCWLSCMLSGFTFLLCF